MLRSSVSRAVRAAGGVQQRVARQHARCASSVGTADLDWGSMLFDYVPTNAHVEYTWRDGEWDAGVVKRKPTVEVSIFSNAFHYGQACFEGLKVFALADGSVAAYQPYQGNHERMSNGAARLGMPAPSGETFNTAIERCVLENLEFVPPYGSDGAMYVRPVLFGCGNQLGLGPAPEYKFIVAVSPVGNYYAGGLQAIPGMVMTKYDRAAGRGIGGVKAGGNYAADVVPSAEAKAAGFPIALYLDAKSQTMVEEFSTSNFIAIDKSGNYVTPKSPSILPSVTNKSLRQIALDLGMGVEEREVPWSEVSEFEEVAACGTAVVLTPIQSLTKGDEVVKFSGFTKFQTMYDRIRGIQLGHIEDKHSWMATLFKP